MSELIEDPRTWANDTATIFRLVTNTEVLRLEPNGDIFVRGRLATNDLEVVDAMREFLTSWRVSH